MDWVWLILGVGAAIGIIVCVVVAWKRRKDDLATLSESDRTRHAEIVQADRQVRAATAAHQRAVKDARRGVERAGRSTKLATLGHVVLTDLDVTLGKERHLLTPETVIELYRDGQQQAVATSRSTFTRIAAGTFVLGPIGSVAGAVAKKRKVANVDHREAYLLLRGAGWGESVKLDVAKMDQAMAFMQKAKGAIDGAQAAYTARAQRVADAEMVLAQVASDTSAIEETKNHRSSLGIDPLAALRADRKAGAPAVESDG